MEIGRVPNEDLETSWHIESENCILLNGGFNTREDKNQESYVSVRIEIVINAKQKGIRMTSPIIPAALVFYRAARGSPRGSWKPLCWAALL